MSNEYRNRKIKKRFIFYPSPMKQLIMISLLLSAMAIWVAIWMWLSEYVIKISVATLLSIFILSFMIYAYNQDD